MTKKLEERTDDPEFVVNSILYPLFGTLQYRSQCFSDFGVINVTVEVKENGLKFINYPKLGDKILVGCIPPSEDVWELALDYAKSFGITSKQDSDSKAIWYLSQRAHDFLIAEMSRLKDSMSERATN